MIAANGGLEAFTSPGRLYSSADVLKNPSSVPHTPGCYGWYFHTIPGVIDVSRCIDIEGRKLLYVGIAPRVSIGSKATVRSRLRSHYGGNAEGSTLRLTLGCLLGLELRRIGRGTVMTFGASEAALSSWLSQNAFVTWIEDPQPWLLESIFIHSLDLPLNLAQNSGHPFHAHLVELRRDARRRAQSLPILVV